MNASDLRAALLSGRRVYGTLVAAPSPVWPPLVRQARADFVFVDTEHIPLDRQPAGWICRAFRDAGIAPIVRVGRPDPYETCQVLDAGAAGVVAPYVETVEEVRAMVGAVRYRPLKGRRLAEALRDPASLEPDLRKELERRNADTTLLVNIESVPAIERLDELLSVPGLDGVLIGPHDLSFSLGVPKDYRHPRFDEAVRTIVRAARSRGLAAGIHYWEEMDQEVEWMRAGLNLLIHGGDSLIFARQLRLELAALREALGDAPPESGSLDGLIV